MSTLIGIMGCCHLDARYHRPRFFKTKSFSATAGWVTNDIMTPALMQNDSLSAMRKSRLHYLQRCEELEKAKVLSAKAEEEFQGPAAGGSSSSSSNKQLEKRRRYRDEAQLKVLGVASQSRLFNPLPFGIWYLVQTLDLGDSSAYKCFPDKH